ncbi:MAG: hypothetical protein LBU34_04610, partial [Planctomycetaceae bacterium]|nr:hypothetical protein [Planctomycetaceae bacterium]
MMQKIFEIYSGKFDEQPCDFVKIYVTWKDIKGSLINLLKIWEAPFAKYPNRPGAYHWKRAATLYRELMVDPCSFPYRTVLDCTCLNEGCWPFQVIVEETENQVLWTKFLQPHRDRDSYADEFWDYSRYPSLVFNKQQYYAELQLLKPIYEEWAKRQSEWEA